MSYSDGDVPNAVFKEKYYWDERFAQEKVYDWLTKFDQVSMYLLPLLKVNDKILMVGCGNSTFSRDLYNAGYKNITNIDFSAVVIDKMKEKYKLECPEMTWEVMDMTDLSGFEDQYFDVVIDKAAMDALAVDEGDVWDPAEHVIKAIDRTCSENARVLKTDGGKFVQISFAQPHFRTKYLMGYRAAQIECSPYEAQTGYANRYNWNLAYQTLVVENGGCLENFLYTMIKGKH